MTAATDIGAGQMAPQDTNSEVNRVSFAVRRILAQYRTLVPVKVIAVAAGQGSPPGPGTVSVQPLVQQIDGSGNATSHGTVNGIQCARMQGGPWTIIVDPAVGDFGFVICADRDMSGVVANSAESPPGSRRMQSLSDGIYVGQILNPVSKAYLWLRSDGTLKIADGGGLVLDTAGGAWTMTGDLTVNGKLTCTDAFAAQNGGAVTGNLTATGEITRGFGGASLVTLGQHFHFGTSGGLPEPGH